MLILQLRLVLGLAYYTATAANFAYNKTGVDKLSTAAASNSNSTTAAQRAEGGTKCWCWQSLDSGHQKPATWGNQVASAEPLIWKVFELIPWLFCQDFTEATRRQPPRMVISGSGNFPSIAEATRTGPRALRNMPWMGHARRSSWTWSARLQVAAPSHLSHSRTQNTAA